MSEGVIAAVPAFNAGEHLAELAAQLHEQAFDEVYILDDCSTDGSIEPVRLAYPHFRIIAGAQNKGPAGNRNRILDVVTDEHILFIDADMTLEATDLKVCIQKALGKEAVGIVGGYIMNTDHQPMAWNYGHEMHPTKDAWFSQVSSTINREDISASYRRELVLELQNNHMDYHWALPSDFAQTERAVDWAAEGLFAIRGEVFRQLEGYDENMMYHEGQDLARRTRDLGYTIVFDPSFSAIHQAIDVRGEKRQEDFRESQFYFFHKHWGISREVFDRLYAA